MDDIEQQIAQVRATIAHQERELQLRMRHRKNLTDIAQSKAAEPGLGDYVRAGLEPLADHAKAIGRGVGAIGQGLLHPVDTIGSDPKRRELERGIADTVTLGYGPPLADWIAKTAGSKDPSLASTEAGDAEAAPGFRTGGGLLGFAVPGAGATIARNGVSAARKLIPAGASLAGNAVRGAGRAVLTNEIAAPLLSGLHAQGGAQPAMEAATDPLNILLAAGAGGVSGLGRSALHMDPVLKRYGAAREAGKYGKGPAGLVMPASSTELHAAAADALRNIVARQGRDIGAAGRQWRLTAEGEAAAPAPSAPAPGPSTPPPAPGTEASGSMPIVMPPEATPAPPAAPEPPQSTPAPLGPMGTSMPKGSPRTPPTPAEIAEMARLDALQKGALQRQLADLAASRSPPEEPWTSVPAAPRPVRSPEAVARSAAGTPIDDGSPISIPDSEVQIADTPVDKHAALRAHLGNVIEEINAEFANRTPVDPYAGGLPRGAPKVPPAIARQAPSLRRPPLADTPVDSGAGRLGALERLLRAETDRGGGGSQEFTPVQAATPGRTGDTPTAYPPTAPPPPMSHFSMAGLTPVVPVPDVPRGLFPGSAPVFEPPPAAPHPAEPSPAPAAAPPARGMDQPVDHAAVIAHLQKEQATYRNRLTGEAKPGRDDIIKLFDEAIKGVAPGTTVRDLVEQRQDIGDIADFRNPNASEKAKAARKVYHALRQGVYAGDKSGNVEKADPAYAAAAKQRGRGRDLLFRTQNAVAGEGGHGPGPEPTGVDEHGAALFEADAELAPRRGKPPESLRPSQEDAAISRIKRVGDTDDAGLYAAPHLDELGTHGHAGDLADYLTKKDYRATRFTLKPTGMPKGVLDAAGKVLGQNLRFAGAKLDPRLGQGVPSWIPEFEMLYQQAQARAQAAEAEKRKARR